MSGISRDEWLAALATVQPAHDEDAFTVAELTDIFGLHKSATKERVKKLVETGAAVAVVKRVPDASGRLQPLPAYRLVTKEVAHGTDHHRARRRRHA